MRLPGIIIATLAVLGSSCSEVNDTKSHSSQNIGIQRGTFKLAVNELPEKPANLSEYLEINMIRSANGPAVDAPGTRIFTVDAVRHHTFENIVTGTYAVTVDKRIDGNDKVLASGSGTVVIEADMAVSLTIQLK